VQFTGTLTIQAPRERVWAFLTDAEAVGPCVPGFEQLDVRDATTFQAKVKAGIGPVRGRFTFDVTWHELTAPDQARLVARGKAPGSAVTADSRMHLTDAAGGGTEVSWTADVVVHGMIASVGARLLDGFVDKQTQQFFECIRSRVEGDEA
jgi:carbon monoxide dehydrogenase subunit G